jgi:hypothetical protein
VATNTIFKVIEFIVSEGVFSKADNCSDSEYLNHLRK